MKAILHQRPGNTWTFEIDFPAFTDEHLVILIEEGIKNLVSTQLSEAIGEALIIGPMDAARIMGYRTTDPVHRFIDLPDKHP
ncbi:hypothetical protein ACD591_16395 [Rufibacter glacialis]|uniref:Uncharacterized protein n=1 Tax=Rufibacter glacialis TaxID=1259555 RepID=A0A5M8QQD5_9BACT|nr:hypothetical protein [Rufibacter glacialis]KAA6437478.1 hypothetical protein FOE74_02965 [Rufibacter glacialis]